MKRFLPILCGAVLACNESQARQPSATESQQATAVVHHDRTADQTELIELPILTRKKLSVAMVQANKSIHIYLEGHSGVRRVDAADTYWVKDTGIARVENQAMHITEVDGHDYYVFSKKKPPLLTTLFKDAANEKCPTQNRGRDLKYWTIPQLRREVRWQETRQACNNQQKAHQAGGINRTEPNRYLMANHPQN